MEEELWQVIDGFEGRYSISTYGNIRRNGFSDSRDRYWPPIILKLNKDGSGYYAPRISYGNKKINLKIHRLVAQAFIPNPENKPQVNHKDGNKTNNYVTNLEWSDNSENIQHAYDIGLIEKRFRDEAYNFKCPIEVLKNGIVIDILYGTKDMRNKGYKDSNIFKCLAGKREFHRGCKFRRVT